MDQKLKRLLEAWREGDNTDQRERVEAIRSHLTAKPAKAADPDGDAVARAVAVLETDPAEAERIMREHFAPAGAMAKWPAMTAGELLGAEDEALDWLVHELLPAGGTSLLIGTPKSGKSSLARTMASKVAIGRPWLGRETKTGQVLYVALDERRATVREHVRTLASGCEEREARMLRERLHVAFGPRPDNPAAALAALIEHLAPVPVLVVIDTLMKAFPFEDANDYGLSGNAMAAVTALAENTGAHVMLVHHARKETADPTTAALGSTRIGADVDVIASLRVDAADKRRLVSFIGRDGVSAADIDVAFADDFNSGREVRGV